MMGFFVKKLNCACPPIGQIPNEQGVHDLLSFSVPLERNT
jgi:hypothetical protein